MVSSLDTSTNNVYNIMNSPSAAFSNTDPNKSLSLGADIQQNVKEIKVQAEKGGTDNYIQSLYKLNVMA